MRELLLFGGSLVGGLFLVFFLPLALVVLARRALTRAVSDAPRQEWRRCRRCGRRWWGVQGSDASRRTVVRRRDARRRGRERGERPEWAAAQGWSRCPSCLSRKVRTSTGSG